MEEVLVAKGTIIFDVIPEESLFGQFEKSRLESMQKETIIWKRMP
tara:strand:- start:11019 stop:11153 length:135 start_codon:yes stop_codon:yes gene_type:complete